jgi:hypothetical protein
VRAREPCFPVAGFAGRIRLNGLETEIAHPARCCDDRHTIELGVGAANGRAYISQWDLQQAGHRRGPDSVRGHQRDNLPLPCVEIGHVVRGTRQAILQLHAIEWVISGRSMLRRQVKLDAHS